MNLKIAAQLLAVQIERRAFAVSPAGILARYAEQ